MTKIASRSKPVSGPSPWAVVGLAVAFAAPLTVSLAIAGLKFGVWGIETAYDLLTWKVALVLAGVGLPAALVAVVAGLRSPRRSGAVALLAVAVSAATLGLFWRTFDDARRATARDGDAYTNSADPPGFSAAIMAERRADAPNVIPFGTGPCDVQAIASQVAPGTAGYALQEAGFTIRTIGVGKADGYYQTTWFDRSYDAVVRIRPGRTDVRVAARDALRDGGAACRLARKIASNLQ